MCLGIKNTPKRVCRMGRGSRRDSVSRNCSINNDISDLKNPKNTVYIRNVIIFSFVILLGIFLYIKLDNNAYSNILDPARAAVTGDLKKYNINVVYTTPDWINEYLIIETSNYHEFKNQCLMESSSLVHNPKEEFFYVLLSEYNQIWLFKINIIKKYEGLTPFYNYIWENSIF